MEMLLWLRKRVGCGFWVRIGVGVGVGGQRDSNFL
jgi:hypothetical protein